MYTRGTGDAWRPLPSGVKWPSMEMPAGVREALLLGPWPPLAPAAEVAPRRPAAVPAEPARALRPPEVRPEDRELWSAAAG